MLRFWLLTVYELYAIHCIEQCNDGSPCWGSVLHCTLIQHPKAGLPLQNLVQQKGCVLCVVVCYWTILVTRPRLGEICTVSRTVVLILCHASGHLVFDTILYFLATLVALHFTPVSKSLSQ